MWAVSPRTEPGFFDRLKSFRPHKGSLHDRNPGKRKLNANQECAPALIRSLRNRFMFPVGMIAEQRGLGVSSILLVLMLASPPWATRSVAQDRTLPGVIDLNATLSVDRLAA